MRLFVATTIFMTLLPAGVARAQILEPTERLGVRSGYLEATGNLDDNFGDGGFLTIHFAQRIVPKLFLDIKIGSLYMGDLRHPEVAERLTNIKNIASEMRILYFSLGPQFAWASNQNVTWYGSAAAGIYSVSMVHDTGLQEFDFSDQHFGANGAIGVMRRIGGTWNFDFNLTVHKFWTEQNDIFYFFTNESYSPVLYQFGFGITMEMY